MKINPNSKPNNIISSNIWEKKWYGYGLRILLVLQILYFSSLAPEALLRLTKYLSIPENIFLVEVLTQIVAKQD